MTSPEARRRIVEERLRALRTMVETTSEHVGRQFAEEARRIHEGDAEERSIYGEATPEEAESLKENGVPVVALPWIDRSDA